MTKKSKQNRQSLWLIVIGFVVLLAAVFFVINLSPPAQVNSLAAEISVSEAYDMYQQGAFMLDVRQPNEYEAGHIPGVTLIPLGELPNQLNELPRDSEIVVVCRSGNRSATGRDILLDAGFTNVSSMAGGMNKWTQSGYEVTTGK